MPDETVADETARRPIALITGGSRGIGAATARALAPDWDVVVTYRVAAGEAAAVVDGCRALGAAAWALPCDVADPDQVEPLFARVDELGTLGAVVNNAGVVPPPGRVADYDAARLDRLLAVNVRGAFLVAGAAVRRMATSAGGAGGVIVNLSSRAAVHGSPGEYVDYAASKAAVDALTTGLGGEVARDGIRVVGVRPGLIETDIHAPGRLERMGPALPMGRPGTAEEVAGAIAWLVSPAASYVTATSVDVGGGR
ncbi:SDR family oxidoreductase [Nocardioides sp. YIM 152588]|uniref:SDR family oxidoreductase n=1 Tax=Nocardioides sp. YIM 152588 TaxID=3158259 RepID=UPI0032E401E7